jgi:tRNA A37 threonylcarbamoyladenosine dehydratase
MENPFIREQMALGEPALEALRKAHVAVFGIGGVGSYTAEALARAGVGNLTLVDNDTVGLSNINRQLCALHSTIGQYKAQVMADRIRDINPECNVRAICQLYSEESKALFFDRDYDYIADCIDLVSCKLSLILNARERQIPILSALGTGNKLDPSQFSITDISKTSGCPLARVIRKELRARGIQHHTVLFSPEEPITPIALEAPPPGRPSIPASVSWVPSVAGLMIAGRIILDLTHDVR